MVSIIFGSNLLVRLSWHGTTLGEMLLSNMFFSNYLLSITYK